MCAALDKFTGGEGHVLARPCDHRGWDQEWNTI
jgi:hypothetical protein